MMKPTVCAALVLALAPSALSAGDYRWGIQAGAVAPLGYMKNRDFIGTGKSLGGPFLGVHFEWEVSPQDAVRVRLSRMTTGFGQERLLDPDPAYGPPTMRSEWGSSDLGVDWRRQYGTREAGWFSTVGVGLAYPELNVRIKERLWADGPMVEDQSDHRQDHRPALRVGAGYQFNRRFQAEVSWHYVRVQETGKDGFGTSGVNWLQVALGIEFGRGR